MIVVGWTRPIRLIRPRQTDNDLRTNHGPRPDRPPLHASRDGGQSTTAANARCNIGTRPELIVAANCRHSSNSPPRSTPGHGETSVPYWPQAAGPPAERAGKRLGTRHCLLTAEFLHVDGWDRPARRWRIDRAHVLRRVA